MSTSTSTAVPIRVAIYARVSSDRQVQEHTIESQVSALRERVAREGSVLEEALCFQDEGVSGTTLLRPALERLRDVAYAGGFKKLYIHSPDRLARRYAYQVLLIDELEKHGVEIVFLNRPPGVNPEENLLLQMQGMFAEYERAKILERSRRGKRHAASQGSVSVLGGAPYGYRYLSRRAGGGVAAYEVYEEQAAIVRQLFEWVGRDRVSICEATRRLRDQAVPSPQGQPVWDRSSVWGMLKNPAYSGFAAFGKTRTGTRRPPRKPPRGQTQTPRRAGSIYDTEPTDQIMIAVPAIVSKELFAAVQEQLTENRVRHREHARGGRHLLQGLLECGSCGYAYSGNSVTRQCATGRVSYAYYRCVGTDAFRFGGTRICHNKQVRQEQLEEAVWRDACELLRHPHLLRNEYARRLANPETSASELLLKQQLNHAQQTVNRLVDAYAAGVLQREEFEPRLKRARQQLTDAESQLETAHSQTRDQTTLRAALASLDDFVATIGQHLDQADRPTRQTILRTLIDRIVVDPHQIRIVYRINFPLFAKNATRDRVLQSCWRRVWAASGTSGTRKSLQLHHTRVALRRTSGESVPSRNS